jgi:hypothetical protein
MVTVMNLNVRTLIVKNNARMFLGRKKTGFKGSLFFYMRMMT